MVKPPLDEISPLGMGIASGADLRHFLNATRTWPSFAHVSKRVLRHLRDMVVHRRGMHLVNGNALIARLLKSADDLGVRVVTSAPVAEVIKTGDRVTGLRVVAGPSGIVVHARRAVVLASGGFPHDIARMAALFPHAPTGREHWSAAPASNTGDGLRLGEQAGGSVRTDLQNAGAWAPVSLVPRADGKHGRFPHLIERAKPGLIMVRPDGRRFANEANSYHDVMQALFAATPPGEKPEAWMICDHSFQRRYGLGRSRPRPFPIRPWLANGYLRRGRTIADLAQACGIDVQELSATVERFNNHARDGADPQFKRGESAYNRVQGEPLQSPNPCVAPIEQGPFYAVRVVPGSLGTFAGLRTDASARVLDRALKPIDGLYAVGNDMSSIMGGRYPAGGITLGPAMTFAYVAAHHISGVPLDNNKS
jgi:succinate dehydrogenase/fumarate reductase flavoprotein subunit